MVRINDVKDRTTSLRLNKTQLLQLRYRASAVGLSVGRYLLEKGLAD